MTTLEDLLDGFKKNVEAGIGSMLTFEVRDGRIQLQCEPTKNSYVGIAKTKKQKED